MPLANYFRKMNEIKPPTFRLSTSLCETCYLFQLDYQPKPSDMFNETYPFFTGLSQNMREHFGFMVDTILSINPINHESFVVELGCNDGTALSFVRNRGVPHLGIDPSENVLRLAENNGININLGFFTTELAHEIVKMHGRASHVFAANVICHIPDLKDLAKGIEYLLQESGIFVFEEPYLVDMLAQVSYDQIYDEHVFIFSLASVKEVFSKYGLFLFDAEHQETHGGSMRYFLSKNRERPMSSRLQALMDAENEVGIKDRGGYIDFIDKCLSNRNDLVDLLTKLKKQGKSVAGYAATSKSTTILNFCKIGPDLIQRIYDSTPEKAGCVTPGSNIPIHSQDELRLNPPDYLVLFAWNHKTEIMTKEKKALPQDQKWILFVPKVEILNES